MGNKKAEFAEIRLVLILGYMLNALNHLMILIEQEIKQLQKDCSIDCIIVSQMMISKLPYVTVQSLWRHS